MNNENPEMVYLRSRGMVVDTVFSINRDVLVAAAKVVEKTDASPENRREWAERFEEHRALTWPGQTREEVLRVTEGRDHPDDPGDLLAQRMSELCVLLSHFLGVVTISALDQISKEAKLHTGDLLALDLPTILERMADKVIILSRVVQSSYVRGVISPDGVTLVNPEVDL